MLFVFKLQLALLFFRIVQWVYYLRCSQSWAVTVVFYKLQGIISMGKLLLVLSLYLTATSILSWSLVPHFLKLMMRLSCQTNELYQLAAVAFCLLSAWVYAVLACHFEGKIFICLLSSGR
ncbi:K(+) efflux antiporter 5-like [Trifolium pratense]|uniref:K(+) efflux antiporter 5-like n=1 Tax=Trifolium pratense TaxID=57577 RepID=UPI001E6930CB|nr:K(+) efflux antiporter 5-like [Trifolium pratense]